MLPIINIENINNDTSLVDFVFQALITWGKKALIVNTDAAKPKVVT